MKKRQKLLTDEQWQLVEPMLPPPRRRRDNRGRPWWWFSWHDMRVTFATLPKGGLPWQAALGL